MTIAVANVANTNTFYYWQTVTNQLAGAMSTAVITTTANGTTAQTAGNAAIGGTFSANIVVTNSMIVNTSFYVGNSTVNVVFTSSGLTIANSTASIALTRPTAAQVSNGQYFQNANGQYTLVPTGVVTNSSVTTTGTATQTVDQWALATYKSAEYHINVKDNNANNYYASKIMVLHDTATAYSTEFAQITTNSAVGVFATTVSGANVVLQFTPTSTNTTVSFVKVVL